MRNFGILFGVVIVAFLSWHAYNLEPQENNNLNTNSNITVIVTNLNITFPHE